MLKVKLRYLPLGFYSYRILFGLFMCDLQVYMLILYKT